MLYTEIDSRTNEHRLIVTMDSVQNGAAQRRAITVIIPIPNDQLTKYSQSILNGFASDHCREYSAIVDVDESNSRLKTIEILIRGGPLILPQDVEALTLFEKEILSPEEGSMSTTTFYNETIHLIVRHPDRNVMCTKPGDISKEAATAFVESLFLECLRRVNDSSMTRNYRNLHRYTWVCGDTGFWLSTRRYVSPIDVYIDPPVDDGSITPNRISWVESGIGSDAIGVVAVRYSLYVDYPCIMFHDREPARHRVVTKGNTIRVRVSPTTEASVLSDEHVRSVELFDKFVSRHVSTMTYRPVHGGVIDHVIINPRVCVGENCVAGTTTGTDVTTIQAFAKMLKACIRIVQMGSTRQEHIVQQKTRMKHIMDTCYWTVTRDFNKNQQSRAEIQNVRWDEQNLQIDGQLQWKRLPSVKWMLL